ncbi:MAG: hypothetical protein WA782_21600 [Sulfitobacter sp.]
MQAPDLSQMHAAAQTTGPDHQRDSLLVPFNHQRQAIKPFLDEILTLTDGDIPIIDRETLLLSDAS